MSDLIKNIFDIKRSESYVEYNNYHLGNIFGITKTSRWELMHSNFIAWALNPDSSHSLQNYPLYQFVHSLMFIKRKPDNESSRLNTDLIYKFYDEDFIVNATVERETEHVDILVKIATKDKILPIIIENKVDSAENGKKSDQTIVYYNWAEKAFADRDMYFEPIYIFLFPEYNSNVIQKCEKYIRMTYQELVDYVLDPSMLKCGDAISINNYKVYLQCLSYQADNEKGEKIMAISSDERKILDNFIKENRNLLISVVTTAMKDDVDPDIVEFLTTSMKDYSTYQFNGACYGKGKLVLAVIKKYVEDKNPLSYDELHKAFPDELIGGKFGVVKPSNLVSDKDKGIGGRKRYFTDASDTIPLSGETILVCSQWGSGNIDKFIDHAINVLGYTITKGV